MKEVAEKFQVSQNVVYSWIDCGVIKARRLTLGSPYWITIDSQKEYELLEWVRHYLKK